MSVCHVILKQRLTYDEKTGVFRAKINNGCNKAGFVVGSMNGNGYIQIMLNGKLYLAHRLAWLYINGEFPKGSLDHINRNKDDNRIDNLRVCTLSQNSQNTNICRNNKSGFKGVHFNKAKNRWVSKAMIKGVSYHIGNFIELDMAAKAYENFAKQMHGEFYAKGELS